MARSLWPSIMLGAVAGVAASVPAIADEPPATSFIDQGWSQEIRELFYFTPQGSRIVPYAWFLALETADGRGMFAESDHLAGYGFIPADGEHPLNPGGLPIGFTIAPVATSALGPDLGLTCAACHTADVTVGAQVVRIDGAPGHVDLDRFYAELSAALTRTAFDPAAFQEFAARILDDPSPEAMAELKSQFLEVQAAVAGDAMIRRPTLDSGPGRVDALTQSINALAVVDQGDPYNLRAVNAPTSYPQLWLAPELEFVQWNPIAANPIGRNGGEVLGVFGTATLSGDSKDWFGSSILIKELHALETWIADLEPPRWDETLFGPIDRNIAATGEGLFRQHCAACHNAPPYRRTDAAANVFGKTFIEIGRVDYRKIGTDPVYIDSLLQRVVRTNDATRRVFDDKAVVSAASYFTKTAGAVVVRAMDAAGLSKQEKAAYGGFRLRPPATPGGEPQPYVPPSITDLKAGPLPGTWVTGSYLHNGSVPTVYELLSPVAERRPVFWTGGRELDRERLGFVSDESTGGFRYDTSLPGNRNTGHLYPPKGLSHDQRMAIIEYLKSL